MLIRSGKQRLEKWFEENDLDNDVAPAVSDSGYSNDEISLELVGTLGLTSIHGKSLRSTPEPFSSIKPLYP